MRVMYSWPANSHCDEKEDFVLVSLKLIDAIFLKLPERPGTIGLPCWERWNISLFSEILTRQGFEVESTLLRGNQLKQVAVGRIKGAEKHPKADKLQVCQVETAAGEVRQIVCGAANARPGLFVAVALPGAVLPNGLEIKISKIRDVESHGMLCSREELGLPVDEARDGAGIWELHNPASCGISESKLAGLLGQPVMFALGLDDVLFELNVTPNRPDMLSHEGVSRELEAGLKWAGVTNTSRLSWKEEWKSSISVSDLRTDALKTNQIEMADALFTAHNELGVPAFFVGLDHVQVVTTPGWMRNLLETLGQKSINSVVDACNLILLAFSQPNHAFDVAKLASDVTGRKSLNLRFATPSEQFLGLDAKERHLVQTDCVVADAKIPQALLGVIGGEYSKVDHSSTSLILEFANPHPVLVRRSSRRHGRKTDSSFAFEKGIDVFRRFEAAEKLVGLLQSLQCNSGNPLKYRGALFAKVDRIRSIESKEYFADDTSGQDPQLKRSCEEYTIVFCNTDVHQRVGVDLVEFEKQTSILKSLGFDVAGGPSANQVKVTVPSWRRLDVAGAADLVEEIVRVVGIDHVPAHPLSAPGKLIADDNHLIPFEHTAQRLVTLGYHETVGFHFMRSDDWSRLNLKQINSCGEPVALLNPIIKDEPLMQSTLLSGLLRKVAHNLNYGTKRGQLFELSRTFQNTSLGGNRVFLNNGEGIGLVDTLKVSIDSPLYEYSSKAAMQLSREETALSDRPSETPRVCAVLFGTEEEKEWLNLAERPWSFHKVAAHVAELLSVYDLRSEFVALPDDHPMKNTLHPGRSAAVIVHVNGQITHLGWVGEFHPSTLRNFQIDAQCLGFELNLSLALTLYYATRNGEQLKPKIKTPLQNAAGVRLPCVERDFAFLVSEGLESQTLVTSVQKAIEVEALTKHRIPAQIIGVKVFDVYRGQGVASGYKSVALRVILLPTERTLVDADISVVVGAVVSVVTQECGAQLRG